MSPAVLGLAPSNYTTSLAVYDGREGIHVGRLLTVRPGELGLRQSDALFQHVQRLPQLFGQLRERGLDQYQIVAVGASTRPRAVEGSYMPCFLAGASQGEGLAHVLGVPFFAHSHQQGHLAAAAWSAGRMDLLDRPFLAWHLSGGTTELLLVEPEGTGVRAEILGGSKDISVGQLIDRTGVLLGLDFPAGKALSALAGEAEGVAPFPVKLDGLSFSLSGMENQVQRRLAEGETPARVAAFALETVCHVVLRATQAAREAPPGLPVLCSGGVASHSRLRELLTRACQAVFAQPQYATDNAMGTAVLTWRALEGSR